MDVEKKFIQLFGATHKDTESLSYMSDARARLIRSYQKSAFELGVEVGMRFMLEEQAKEKDDREEQNDLEHLYRGDY